MSRSNRISRKKRRNRAWIGVAIITVPLLMALFGVTAFLWAQGMSNMGSWGPRPDTRLIRTLAYICLFMFAASGLLYVLSGSSTSRWLSRRVAFGIGIFGLFASVALFIAFVNALES